ncbi:MAG: right-handed parallel beta-helix repeat-containing protein [Chloroflexi bacterium]|nr:right-handed parallel beta-helix repeat-containing protein [Chloroflexota bacterium]MBP8057706.1 right-handed parallel beta-helix repeat-containing protein [Chloroflexota bacterium]
MRTFLMLRTYALWPVSPPNHNKHGRETGSINRVSPVLLLIFLSACSPISVTQADITLTPLNANTPAAVNTPTPTAFLSPLPEIEPTSTLLQSPYPLTSPTVTPFPPTALPTATPSGNVYHVAPDGNDGNSGTLEQPWRTVQHAADNLAPGDTVYLHTGTYYEHVIFTRSGSPEKMITLSAYPGETVTLDGEGFDMWNWSGVIDLSGQHHIRVSGLQIINSSYAGVFADGGRNFVVDHLYTYNTASSGIAFFGTQEVLVDSNEVVWAGSGGVQEHITLANTQNFEVRYNHVHDFNPATGGKEGIDAKDGSANGSIHHNHVHDLDRVGIYVDAYAQHTYNIQVYANEVHDIAADGFSLAAEAGGLLENISLYNNLAYDNMNHGLSLSNCCDDLAANHPMQHILIINNTFANNGWDWGGGIRIANPDMTDVIMRNNILSQNASFQLLTESWAQAVALTVDYNLIDGYRGQAGEFYGEGYVTGSPLFVNTAQSDFHLQPQSPAIDAGSSLDAPSVDFADNPRPLGGDRNGTSGVDIGAYEWVPGDG